MKISINDAIVSVESTIESFESHDVPSQFTDSYRRVLAELLAKKADGKTMVEMWETSPKKDVKIYPQRSLE